MKQKRKKNKSIILRLFALFICAYFTVTLANLWNNLNESRAELEALKSQYDAQYNDIQELKAILNSDDNSALIEKAARESLGYIYSDEQVFIDISGN